MTAIVRGPSLKVRFRRVNLINSLALRLVQVGKISVNDSCRLCCLAFFIVNVHHTLSIDQELLRCTARLCDNIFDVEGSIGDINFGPGGAIVPSKLNLLRGYVSLGSHD